MAKKTAIGIDLGTTYRASAVVFVSMGSCITPWVSSLLIQNPESRVEIAGF